MSRFKGATWDSMFLAFVKVLTTITSIVLTKILAVGLSLAEYGTYSQANLIVSIGTSILFLGLGDALNYFYNNKSGDIDFEKRKSFVNSIFSVEIIAGICFAAILSIIKGNITAYFSNEALAIMIGIVSVKPMLDNLIYFYQLLYISIGKAKLIAIRNLVIALAKMAAMYLTVMVLHDLRSIFIALILIDIAQLVFFKLYFAKEGFWVNPLKGNVHNIRSILAYGIPMGVFSITNILTRDIDKLVVGRLADTEALAVYTNCSRVLPFDIIAVSFATVLIPYIMNYVTLKQKENALSLFRNYIKVGYYSVWILAAAVLVTAKQAVSFLYSDAYLSGTTVFILYVLDSMLRFASMHLILTASGRSKTLMMYSLVSLVLNTLLNIVLFKMMGMVGPAVATLLCAFVYMMMVLNASIKLLDAKWLEIFDLKDMLRFVSFLAVSGAVLRFVNNWLISTGIHKYICMIATIAVFGLVNLFINYTQIKKVLKEINQLRIQN